MSGDPNYPFPGGEIGEYGFDPLTLKVHNRHSIADFMSYCFPTWVSPYTYVVLWSETCGTYMDNFV